MSSQNKKASIAEFFKVIVSLIPNFKSTIWFFTITTVIIEIIKFIPVYLVSTIIDGIIDNKTIEYQLTLVAGIFISLTVMQVIDIYILRKIIKHATQEQKNLLDKIFQKALKLPLQWHEANNTGDMISKVQKSSSFINQLTWFSAKQIVPSLVQIILTGALLIWIDYRIGLIYILATPLILHNINKMFKGVQPIRETSHAQYDDATKNFAQTIYNIKTVQEFNMQSHEQNMHQENLQNYLDHSEQRAKIEFKNIFFRDTLTNLVRAGSMALAVYLVYQGSLTAGTLVFVFTIIEKAYTNLHRLGHVYSMMGDTYEALSQTSHINQATNHIEDKGTEQVDSHSITFDNVKFSYEEEDVLKNITFKAKSKRSTAIIGPSGAGKSTIVNLMTRHYERTGGDIYIGDKKIENISLANLRKSIAFVSQETQLFDRSVRENIAYGKQNATEKQIINAAKKANAHAFIKNFEKGYDTILGENGVRLSGGQKQRISIARALLSDAKIIIFDEATSSLDTESEKAIQNAISKIKGKTMILIAHRLSTIKHADNIIVIKEGCVEESGTHKELMNKKGIYAKMINLQNLNELRE